jgi:cytochrome c556
MPLTLSSDIWSHARRGLMGAALVLLVAGCGQQASEEAATEAAVPAPPAVAERQEGFKAMGAAFKVVNDQLKTDAPDMAAIAEAADRMNGLAGEIPTWFPAGSGPDDGVKTDALATVWSDPEGFAAAQVTLVTATVTLQQLAAARDAAGLREHVKMVGASCGGCHDKYKAE